MIQQTAALRYSKALFEIDKANGLLEKRVQDFESLLELLKKQPKLMKFFQAPQIELNEKESFLQLCLGDKFDPTFLHFLNYLMAKGRLNFLNEIASEYRLRVNEYLGIWEVEMITATKLEPETQDKMKKKLEDFYQKKIKIKNNIDPKIIGGSILVIANEMIDWSVLGRLKKMKEHLLEISVKK